MIATLPIQAKINGKWHRVNTLSEAVADMRSKDAKKRCKSTYYKKIKRLLPTFTLGKTVLVLPKPATIKQEKFDTLLVKHQEKQYLIQDIWSYAKAKCTTRQNIEHRIKSGKLEAVILPKQAKSAKFVILETKPINE